MEKDIENPYLRIGTEFFKITYQPLASGDKSRKISKWSKQNIKDDHVKTWQNEINRMPKYDGFCLVPNHIDHKRVIGDFYNLYESQNKVNFQGL